MIFLKVGLKMENIHPKLESLLEEYNLDHSDFDRKGRLPSDRSKEIKEKRAKIVTALHEEGTKWEDMASILGKPISFIQRYSNAKGNPATQENRVEAGKEAGKKCRGMDRPWLSERMEEDWENGKFDFHKGRERPEEEIEKIKGGWTEEKREKRSEMMEEKWDSVEYREKLLEFHRSEEERARRSKQQSKLMREKPELFCRGNQHTFDSSDLEKCEEFNKDDGLLVRSSYEKAAVIFLEESEEVTSYQYEPTFHLDWSEGFDYILPDFLVKRSSDCTLLVEVKASWQVEGGLTDRLEASKKLSDKRGWSFSVWTEKGKLDGLV